MSECPYLKDGLCVISTNLARMDVPAAEDACIACKTDPEPMQRNHVTCSKAIHTLVINQKPIPPALLISVKRAPKVHSSGPGTELEKLISWFKRKTSKCGCGDRIKKMNMWGPDKCEENMDTILGWLEKSAAENNMPFIRPVARWLVQKAIERSRCSLKKPS